MINPFMGQYFINGWPLTRIIVQNLSNDVTCKIGDGNVLWEVIRVHTDPLVGGLDVGSLERWLANNERVDNDS